MAGNCLSVFICHIHSLESEELISFVYQVKSGTLFDNVLITDDPEYAKKLAEETWEKNKDVCCFILFSPWK